MKQLFDSILALFLIIILSWLMLAIAVAIKLTSKGPVFYWSDRVGKKNIIFKMPKFRTMVVGTPSMATHLIADPKSFITPIGTHLRNLSLDELPQLYSIITGKMTFVGPRPALYNQDDLIELRRNKGLVDLKPGVTGWAQVNGRDELSIERKVFFEEEYLKKKSFLFDMYIIWLTLQKVLRRDGISH